MNLGKPERPLEELLELKREILVQRDQEQTHLWQNNISDYVSLRNFNLTAIQEELTSIGLSSLGCSQTCVMSSIHQNIKILEQLLDKPQTPDEHDYLDFKSAKKILKDNAKIFGTSDDEHYKSKVMVTLPSEAAQSDELIKDLIAQDVSVLRINTAGAWIKMALFIKEQNQKHNKDTKIYVDLAGPKNRTGEFEKSFTPFKIGSKKVEVEVEILPQSHQVALTQASPTSDTSATLAVEDDVYARCRDKWRTIKIMDNEKQILHTFRLQKGKEHIAIVPKIETKRGVKNLPSLLAQLLKRPNDGAMMARGDLAIEVGFDNLPYIQEEIFDICESALVPVIYATQILEGKMKNNLPARAEVIDAAFAQRADCIMLNKSHFVVDTVIILKKILHSMHLIYEKNRQLLNISTTWSSDNQNERIEI